MSKSLGNFVTIRELLATTAFGASKWHGAVLRLAMLMTHYRQPIDWTAERLAEVRKALAEWINVAAGVNPSATVLPQESLEVLADDLNTPGVVTMLHALHREARAGNVEAAAHLHNTLRFLGVWNGETADEIANYGLDARDLPSREEIDGYIAARTAARSAKNFAESDRIRDELAAKGIVLKDGKGADGKPVTTWEVAR